MKIKIEFLRRLWRLYHELDIFFDKEYHFDIKKNKNNDVNIRSIFPALFSVINYLWTTTKIEKNEK